MTGKELLVKYDGSRSCRVWLTIVDYLSSSSNQYANFTNFRIPQADLNEAIEDYLNDSNIKLMRIQNATNKGTDAVVYLCRLGCQSKDERIRAVFLAYRSDRPENVALAQMISENRIFKDIARIVHKGSKKPRDVDRKLIPHLYIEDCYIVDPLYGTNNMAIDRAFDILIKLQSDAPKYVSTSEFASVANELLSIITTMAVAPLK